MKRPRLVEEIVLDNAVGEVRPARIERHLQILIVDFDMMEGEFDVAKNAQPSWLMVIVLYLDVPQLYIVFEGDEQRLLGFDPLVITQEFGIRKAVAALVIRLGEILPDRLPGNRPKFAGVVVPQIDIMTGPVERYSVLTEASDPMMFGVFVK